MSFEGTLAGEHDVYTELKGTTQSVTVIAAVNGALIVSLELNSLVFQGVLLKVTENLKPAVLNIPKPSTLCRDKELELRTEFLALADVEGENIGSSTQYRSTYQKESPVLPADCSSQQVIESRSLHKIHGWKSLRSRRRLQSRFYLCSMCRTHCRNSSDDEISKRKDRIPAIKISYRKPDGQSIMDIIHKKPKKRKHSKHKKDKTHRRHADDHEMSTLSDNSSVDKRLIVDLPKLTDSELLAACGDSPSATAKSPKTIKFSTNEQSFESDKTNERKTHSASTYKNVDGRQISVGDVIWGKIVGFPWWPGRVCAITVTETADGHVLDHVADIDWYCSPTKSHLSCSQLYPFLDYFEKRFDKKKKSSSYKNAISEAKYDAVLSAQYMESLDEDEPGLPSALDNTSIIDSSVNVATVTSDGAHTQRKPAQTILPYRSLENAVSSHSMLIDAFLRKPDDRGSTISDSGSDVFNSAAAPQSDQSCHTAKQFKEDAGDYVTIPSPQSLLP